MTYYTSLGYSYTITITDSWFEANCGYMCELTDSSGVSFFLNGGAVNMLGAGNGFCVYGFVYSTNDYHYGATATFYKIKP